MTTDEAVLYLLWCQGKVKKGTTGVAAHRARSFFFVTLLVLPMGDHGAVGEEKRRRENTIRQAKTKKSRLADTISRERLV